MVSRLFDTLCGNDGLGRRTPRKLAVGVFGSFRGRGLGGVNGARLFQQCAEAERGVGVTASLGPPKRGLRFGYSVLGDQQHREVERAVGVTPLIRASISALGAWPMSGLQISQAPASEIDVSCGAHVEMPAKGPASRENAAARTRSVLTQGSPVVRVLLEIPP